MSFWRKGMIGSVAAVLMLTTGWGGAQDRRARKYKAPPPTSRIEVTVIKHATGKPISNAAVILHATKDGKDDGALEIKTDPDGKASLDVIETGSHVLLQVFASGYATYAQEFDLSGPNQELHVALLKPREQVSAYEDNSGKAASIKPGIQEPRAPRPANSAEPTLIPRGGSGSGESSGTPNTTSGAAGASEQKGSATNSEGTKSTQSRSDNSAGNEKQDTPQQQGTPQP